MKCPGYASLETGSRLVVARRWGRERWVVPADGYSVSVRVMKTVWNETQVVAANTVSVLNAIELFT